MTCYKYLNIVWKCDVEKKCEFCTANGYVSPLPVFKKMKSQGLSLPVPYLSKYLSYEEAVKHPDRFLEQLPRQKHTKKKGPFELKSQRSRNDIRCTDCSKSRIVYSKSKLTPEQADSLDNLKDSLFYRCGDLPFSALDTQFENVLVCDQNLKCKYPVETGYYSVLVGKKQHPVICRNCGSDD